MTDDRRTIRIPDSEWEAAQRDAGEAGESVSDRVRRLLREAALTSAGAQTVYRATLLEPAASTGKPVIVHIDENLAEDEIRKLFPRKTWLLEARDVTGWRPASKRPLQQGNRGN
ncbi:hypothetical protein [Nocardia sp. NPDC051570]|uniref:hypothetical protein n=1 Tax=Nocardia sp. NPDC051570 TaxID=3364324 RepID=UPI0037A0402E